MGDEPNGSQSSGTLLAVTELQGIAGSPGVAIGPVEVVTPERPRFTRRRIQPNQVQAELEHFDALVRRATDELRRATNSAQRQIGQSELSILDAYVLMLNDVTLRENVQQRIEGKLHSVERAVDGAVADMAQVLRATQDPYLRERSRDIEFVGELLFLEIAREQQEAQRQQTGSSEERESEQPPRIIIARDLSPAQTATFNKEQVLALVTEVGTRSSHTSILARALEIPAVVGCKGVMKHVLQHPEMVIVDGNRGRVVISPTAELVEGASKRARKQQELFRDLKLSRDVPATTRCGVPIQILANIELPHEANIAVNEGAQGIGLYRTEFLFIGRSDAPGEDEQYEVYKSVLQRMGGRPVVLRTFDIGGDKFNALVPVSREQNPALGVRAVRLGLAQPEDLLTQLRAIVRASAHGPLSVMVPLVSAVSELEAVSDLLELTIREIDKRGLKRAAHIPLGCMIEVPAAALNASHLAKRAEFFSVGTNDLVQYTLAVDRSNQELAHLASHFDPAVLKLIQLTAQQAQPSARPVAICGAMASDPYAAILLLGMGLRTLSMEAAAIPEVKAALHRVSLAEAETITREALAAASASEVETAVKGRFGDRFADLTEFD